MMVHVLRCRPAVLVCMVAFAAAGCSKEVPPAPKQTASQAVEQMCVQYRYIRDAFERQDPDAAHGPLHEVGYALHDLEDAAAEELRDSEKLAALKKLTASLFDDFGAVDRTMHGREGSTWPEVAERIATTINELRGTVGLPGEVVPKKPATPEVKATDDVQPEPAPEPAGAPAPAPVGPEQGSATEK